jgi:hypothetical protein
MRFATRQERYAGLTDEEILLKWKYDGTRAADLGTAMHAIIEEMTLARIEKGVYSDNSTIISDIVDGDTVVVHGEHLRALFAYLDSQGMIPLSVEKPVFDPDLLMAGMTDAMFQEWDTGDLYLYDWKRRKEFTTYNPFNKGLPGTPAAGLTKSHQTSAMFQLNIYADILRRGENTIVDAMRICSIHPESGVRVDTIPLNPSLTHAVASHRLNQLYDSRMSRNPQEAVVVVDQKPPAVIIISDNE